MWQHLPQLCNKSLYTWQVFAWFAIGLYRLAYHKQFDLFSRCVVLEEIDEFRRRDSRQSPRYDFQGIGDRQSTSFLSVVDRKYSCHYALFSEQPSVRIFCPEIVATCSCLRLAVECSCNNTIHVSALVLYNLCVIAFVFQLGL